MVLCSTPGRPRAIFVTTLKSILLPGIWISETRRSALRRLVVAEPKEGKHVPVGVHELEAPQPVVYE
jgi:hypothetical protein